MIVDLPSATWQTLLAMLAEHHVPRHAAFPAIHQLEVALKQAQQQEQPNPIDAVLPKAESK